MGLINVKTGFGYYRDSQGRIVSKAELPRGEHLLPNELEYVEVADTAELAAVEVYQDPAAVEDMMNETKITNRIRQVAIDELKSEGKLPQDYGNEVTHI